MKIQILILNILILFQLFCPGVVLALETAPAITDREVVEKLAKLEAGQQALNQRISDLRSEMKSGQEALRSEMKLGQEAQDKRFDDLNQRIGDAIYIMTTIFGTVIALIAVLIGYMLWDRRTMMKPVIERVKRIEQDVVQEFDQLESVVNDLDLHHSKGSLVTRLLKVLRKYARNNSEIAEIMRELSLLRSEPAF
ncbi:MAG: hypothetical protein U9N77_03320 [Thermodesulfobacteriota bacterium]|nr:hypothetical protein [Thermodesulfobacteriota bacterium]